MDKEQPVDTRAKLIAKLQNKEYRDAFVGSQINIELPFQIRALREKRGWSQEQLAREAGMLQPRISAMETPGKGKLKLETLRRIAAAFDVGLIVRLAPFSEMIEWVIKFSPDSFTVLSCEEDMQAYVSAAKIGLRAETTPAPTRVMAPLLSVSPPSSSRRELLNVSMPASDANIHYSEGNR